MGVDVEVIDPRTLVPLDKRAILDSVAKTGRLVVADETRLNCGVASEISAIVAEEGFGSLKAPILRVARPNAPVSAAPTHEVRDADGGEHRGGGEENGGNELVRRVGKVA